MRLKINAWIANDDRKSQLGELLWVPLAAKWIPDQTNTYENGGYWTYSGDNSVKMSALDKLRLTNKPIPDAIQYVGDSLLRTSDEKMFRTLNDYQPIWMQKYGHDDWVQIHKVDESNLVSFFDSIKMRVSKLKAKIHGVDAPLAMTNQLHIARSQLEIISSIDSTIRYIRGDDLIFLAAMYHEMISARTIEEFCKLLVSIVNTANPHFMIKSSIRTKIDRLTTMEWLYNEINKDHSMASKIRSYISM